MKFPVEADASAANETPPAESSPADVADLAIDYPIIDLLPAMAWTAKVDGTLDFVNQQWCAFTGMTRQQLLTAGVAGCMHPDDLKFRQEILAMIAQQRAFEYEVRLRRYDGEYRRCLARAVPVRDGNGQVTRWVGTTMDVEEMRRTTDELKLTEGHMQLALDSADIGIWRIKLPDMELTVDERTRRHLDLDRRVIADYHPDELIHPDDYARTLSTPVPLGEGRHITEHRIRLRDGSYRWQAIHWRVLSEGEGDNATPVLITGTSTDVTPRKEAEAEREELGQRYRMALDAAELGTWDYNITQGRYHLDVRACAHFGVDQPTLTPEQYVACIHEADREQTIQDVRRKLSEPASMHRAAGLFRVRRPDGEVRWLSVQVKIIFADGESGRPERLIGVTRDVTETMLADIKLRESEERLRQFANNIEDALWLGDPQTMRPQYLSPAYEQLFGLSMTAQARDPWGWLQSIHPADREYVRSMTEKNFLRGFTTEFRVVRPDGSLIWVRNRSFPVHDDHGELIHIGGIVEDITQRKQFEESLRAERERFDRMVAVVPGVLYSYRYISPGAGQLLYMSPGLADLHGVTHEELANDAASMFRWTPPEDILRARQLLQETIHGTARWQVDYRVCHPSMGLMWMSSSAELVREADGTTILHGFIVDITARKRAEEQVQRLNADLELRVQQRTAELTAANEELESFAYAVSHDLRAPLRAIWGFCDALIEDYGPSLPPQAHEYLRQVIDGSHHLAEIIDGLLALSRSTRGTLRRDQIDLSSMAEKILHDLARVEPGRHVRWSIQPALRACGDSRMIDAVMRNLLGNAWKYTANRNDAFIRVYSDCADGKHVFCVEDNGAGFSMEHAKKLFQPFQRLHRQDEFSGLGIGLATVQRIIHRHGGSICGTGAADRGALFRFSLPLPDDPVVTRTEQERER